MNKQKTHGQPDRKTITRLGGLLVVAAALSGCGESNPELSESRNYFIEAQEAINAGDSAKAIELLKDSIEAQPSTWAYFELAKLQVEAGDDQAALASIDAGLQIDPEHADMKWLKGEIEKPEGKRFVGRNKNPPSASK